ncbi:MAG: hydroxymethylbilane synthase [Planctomycetota bacterium]|nr:MAG: hydroxymethylbilane synthase [Planctomycetota bacterium]REJ97491.1 MAG: hydroxymethylbilane synthase [Planctomycetota bacterium]REK20957.1 MAG: hydroxymethylbilane synthase [Planctomycetota bacterium]REK37261.1 MAG: hydroxymethylbilane synthase [Planctomycetota bacterium]
MTPSPPPAAIRIATRASSLALWQAEHVAALLRNQTATQVELVHVSTSGDQDRTRPLAEMGGVGVFTREVQRAVLDGRADIAVHSLKDLPTDTVDGLALAGIPERAPRFDVLVLPSGQHAESIDDLPASARIGTGSLRRRAQLLHHRSDLLMQDIRGNVETRLRKLDDGEYDAIVLAEAGLTRLGLKGRISIRLEPPLMLPAVGQAAIGIECRADDEPVIELLQQITDPVARAETTAERACLAELRAGCHAPVGVWARRDDDQLLIDAVVLSPDGQTTVSSDTSGSLNDAEQLGRDLAGSLLEQGADALIRA